MSDPVSVHCFICSKEITAASSNKLDDLQTNSESKSEICGGGEICSKFFVLASRYLDFTFTNHEFMKPWKTLNMTWKENNNSKGVQACENCVITMDSYCDMYELLQHLQLELHQCLEKIADTIWKSVCVDIQEQNADANVANPSSNRVSVTTEYLQDFKKAFANQIYTTRKKTFPHLKLQSIVPSKGDSEADLNSETEKVITEESEKTDALISNTKEVDAPQTEKPPYLGPISTITSAIRASSKKQLRLKHLKKLKTKKNSASATNKSESTGPIRSYLYKCKFCSKYFTRRISRKNHERVHKIDKTSGCKMCSTTCYKNYSSNSHKDKITKSKPRIKCALCPKSFLKESRMLIHLTSHRKDKPESFTPEVREESEPIVIECTEIKSEKDSAYDSALSSSLEYSQPSLRNSVASEAPEKPSLYQELNDIDCFESIFPNPQPAYLNDIVQDQINDSTGEQLFQCRVCNKEFANQGVLLIHLRGHNQWNLQSPMLGYY